jgi:hypothetical protein
MYPAGNGGNNGVATGDASMGDNDIGHESKRMKESDDSTRADTHESSPSTTEESQLLHARPSHGTPAASHDDGEKQLDTSGDASTRPPMTRPPSATAGGVLFLRGRKRKKTTMSSGDAENAAPLALSDAQRVSSGPHADADEKVGTAANTVATNSTIISSTDTVAISVSSSTITSTAVYTDDTAITGAAAAAMDASANTDAAAAAMDESAITDAAAAMDESADVAQEGARSVNTRAPDDDTPLSVGGAAATDAAALGNAGNAAAVNAAGCGGGGDDDDVVVGSVVGFDDGVGTGGAAGSAVGGGNCDAQKHTSHGVNVGRADGDGITSTDKADAPAADAHASSAHQKPERRDRVHEWKTVVQFAASKVGACTFAFAFAF